MTPTLPATGPLTPETRKQALAAAERLVEAARVRLSGMLGNTDGRIDPARLSHHQTAAHGFAWAAAHVEGLKALHIWAEAWEAGGSPPQPHRRLLTIGFGEYCARLASALPMSMVEFARAETWAEPETLAAFRTDPAVRASIEASADPDVRRALTTALCDHDPNDAFDPSDASLEEFRAPFRTYAVREIAPHCHRWHLDDLLIPDSVVEDVAELGAFAVSLPEAHGGLGQSKQAMVAVTEELSAVHLASGSLATRAEIAGELITQSGTEEQKARFLPRIASGDCLPTAMFTEPDTGSDLAHIRTRAVREGDAYIVNGAKTWITHGARSDLMTLLVRTDPESRDHRGVSMLLGEKPRGSVKDPFPGPGLSGAEITTIGYRGLKEYEIGLDGFRVATGNLLGGVEGEGFRQLMATFETARIQTAARAVGVARGAVAEMLGYAMHRKQFGRPLVEHARISDKIALAAAETLIVRQLTLAAARAKDSGRRSDIEAGMAKLLGARIAWAAADDGLQTHGGMGYASDTPMSRIFLDARILNIFEGTGEIQAQIIARGLLDRRN